MLTPINAAGGRRPETETDRDRTLTVTTVTDTGSFQGRGRPCRVGASDHYCSSRCNGCDLSTSANTLLIIPNYS